MLLHRIHGQIRKRGSIDMWRKILYFFSQKKDQLSNPIKKIRTWVYFKNSNVRLGKAISLKGLSYNVLVGTGCEIYDHCIFEMIGEEAQLSIGYNCLFSYGVLLSCNKSIKMGNNVMIGEYTSIRDTSHSYADISKPMKNGPDTSTPVSIGNDVWVGRGCLIMEGTIIEDGVVVAANSVVKGRLEKFGIYGGVPAKLIKKRN